MINLLNTLNEGQIKKLKSISSLVKGPVTLPSFKEKEEAKTIIEYKLSGEGSVTFKYAEDVLIALGHAQEKKHIFNENLLLDDIKADETIKFPYYQ